MMKILFINTFIFLSVASNCQKIIINGKEGNRKLTWADFTGKVDKQDSYFAYTHWSVSPKLDNIRIIGDSVSVGSFLVTLELDPVKSWAKKDHLSDELLVHEQGHFDLGVMCLNEILSSYKQLRLTKSNWNTALQDMVSRLLTKYDGLMKQYDKETNHSNNKEEQKKWNKFFEDSLKK
jgi:hypothetical protein